jgi:TRAP-type C4-dicarboxylate transport system permease small subunit
MRKTISSISNAISWGERSLVVALLVVMILLAFLQVILRNFFSMGFMWADPLLRHMVLWVGFVGASLATQKDRHINLDIITRFLPKRTTIAIRIAMSLFASTVTAFLAKAGWIFLRSEAASGETLLSFGGMYAPAWWFQVIIPIGFGLLSFRFFLRALEHIADLGAGKEARV